MALPNGHRGVASPVTKVKLRLSYVKMGLNYAKVGRRGEVIHRLGISDHIRGWRTSRSRGRKKLG